MYTIPKHSIKQVAELAMDVNTGEIILNVSTPSSIEKIEDHVQHIYQNQGGKSMEKFIFLLTIILLITSCAQKPQKDYPIKPVPFTDVQIKDNFWQPRIETNRMVTIPYDFKKCEETGRIDH